MNEDINKSQERHTHRFVTIPLVRPLKWVPALSERCHTPVTQSSRCTCSQESVCEVERENVLRCYVKKSHSETSHPDHFPSVIVTQRSSTWSHHQWKYMKYVRHNNCLLQICMHDFSILSPPPLHIHMHVHVHTQSVHVPYTLVWPPGTDSSFPGQNSL